MEMVYGLLSACRTKVKIGGTKVSVKSRVNGANRHEVYGKYAPWTAVVVQKVGTYRPYEDALHLVMQQYKAPDKGVSELYEIEVLPLLKDIVGDNALLNLDAFVLNYYMFLFMKGAGVEKSYPANAVILALEMLFDVTEYHVEKIFSNRYKWLYSGIYYSWRDTLGWSGRPPLAENRGLSSKDAYALRDKKIAELVDSYSSILALNEMQLAA